jgi:uncharacterized membrane protein
MSWIYIVVALPVVLLVVALIHDFLSSLSDERVWADPAIEDSRRAGI